MLLPTKRDGSACRGCLVEVAVDWAKRSNGFPPIERIPGVARGELLAVLVEVRVFITKLIPRHSRTFVVLIQKFPRSRRRVKAAS